MFTGIIEEMGYIQRIDRHEQGTQFHIQTLTLFDDVKEGDSIAVNGCCLTVISYQSKIWACDVVQETLNQTNFRHLNIGDKVNLERSLRYQGRLGGHLIQGHIDGTGQIVNKYFLADGSSWVTIATSPALLRYGVKKGSIAVDGVSLTIAELNEKNFSFAMIPYTSRSTILGVKQVGDYVNLEVDLMAKYIERLIYPFQSDTVRGYHDQHH